MAAAQGTETPAVDEDAAELQFPKEFELADTKTLLISEVNILLEHRKQQVPISCNVCNQITEQLLRTIRLCRPLAACTIKVLW